MTIASSVATAALTTAASEGVKKSGMLDSLVNHHNWPMITGAGVVGFLYFNSHKGKVAGLPSSSLKWVAIGATLFGGYLFMQARKHPPDDGMGV